MLKSKSSSKSLARSVIEELGFTALVADFQISKGAISQWKQKGIPAARLLYLKIKYPRLKSWKLEAEKGSYE